MRWNFEKLVSMYPQSLISEFYKMFGSANTEKLLAVFAGTELHIPSTKDLEEATRDIAIFETLTRSKGAGESRRLGEILAAQYHITRVQVRQIYWQMWRRARANKKLSESDKATGQHKRKLVRIQRKTKRTL